MAVEVVGGSARVGHSICIRALVHVGHTRSLSVHVTHYHMMCAYISRAWEDRLLYKVYERRLRSQCVVIMAVIGCMFHAMS